MVMDSKPKRPLSFAGFRRISFRAFAQDALIDPAKSAAENGAKAAREGRTLGSNPYPLDTPAHAQWRAGYAVGRKAMGRDAYQGTKYESKFSAGDPVTVTYGEYTGKKGMVTEVSPSGLFYIVKVASGPEISVSEGGIVRRGGARDDANVVPKAELTSVERGGEESRRRTPGGVVAFKPAPP